MKKHFNLIKNVVLFLFAVSFLSGCGNKKRQKNFVAKVNNVYLTGGELAEMIQADNYRHYKSEIIRSWVIHELLYQQAKKEGILNGISYKRIIGNSKKELAGALLVQKVFNKQKITYVDKDIEDYYSLHKNEFELSYKSYLINRIDFNNENNAVQFRNIVLENNWVGALDVFVGDTSIIQSSAKKLLYDYELSPPELYKVVKELNPGDVSIVLHYRRNNFTIVQLLKKFGKGTIPSLELIRKRVIKRFIADKKNILLKNYINNLYSNNDIEVKH